MRNLNNLLKKARHMLPELFGVCFPPDDDDFIEALGVDPKLYAVKDAEGNVGYDFMAALNFIAAEVWNSVN